MDTNIKQKLKKFTIKTIFDKRTNIGDGDFSLDLDQQITLTFPKWGQDRVMSFSLSKSQLHKNQLVFTGSLFSGGLFAFYLKDNRIEVHS